MARVLAQRGNRPRNAVSAEFLRRSEAEPQERWRCGAEAVADVTTTALWDGLPQWLDFAGIFMCLGSIPCSHQLFLVEIRPFDY